MRAVAPGIFLMAMAEQPAAFVLQCARITEQFLSGLIEIAILTGGRRKPDQKRAVDVHAIDPDLVPPARRVRAMAARTGRAFWEGCVECRQRAGGIEQHRIALSFPHREQFAPWRDMILVRPRDATPDPPTHQAVDEAVKRLVPEDRRAGEKATQRDRLAKAPYAVIPPHGRGRRARQQVAVAHAGTLARTGDRAAERHASQATPQATGWSRAIRMNT